MNFDSFNPRPRADLETIARVKRWAMQLLRLPDSALLMVTELRCSEPGCPPLETVIAILDPGPSRQIKIPKPVGDVTLDDVALQVRSVSEGGCGCGCGE